jgi:ABC-type multidrug transport system fused ATPase/permease subunit
VLHDAESVAGVLEELLTPDHPGTVVDLYLVDPVPEGASVEDDSGHGAVLVVESGDSPVPVAMPVTRMLVRAWFGADAASIETIIDGLAGLAAARAGIGLRVEDADRFVRERGSGGEWGAGPPPGLGDQGGPPPGETEPLPGSGRAPMGGVRPPHEDRELPLGWDQGAPGGPPPGGPPPGDTSVGAEGIRPEATSFVAYLVATFGGAALRSYLQSYDPARTDQAAIDAFQQPLGNLEESWRKSVTLGSTGPTISSFLRYILPHLKPYWWREAEVFLYMLVGSVMEVVSMPVAIAAAVGALGELPAGGGIIGNVQKWLRAGDVGSRLVLFILALLAIYSFDALITMRRAVVSETITQRLLMSLQERMFAHLQRLPESYFSHANVGDVMSRLSGDIQLVSMTMTTVLNQGVYILVSTVVAGIFVLSLNLWLGLLVLIVVPMFLISYRVLGGRLGRASYDLGNRTGDAATVTQENLTAHSVIKAFGMEERAMASYHARLEGVLRAALRMVRISALFDATTSIATTLGQLIVLGVGGWLVLRGDLEVVALTAFLLALPSLLAPMAQFSGIGETLQQMSGSLARVMELLDVPVTITDKPDAIDLEPLSTDVRLDRVTFSYDAGRPILQELDITIPAGKMAAIVGPSGSGKSTIVNLLLRFWDPQGGRLLFDDHDLRDVTMRSLRSQIGLVFQDTFVFDTTVRENIAMGRPGALDDEIIAAARGAQLADYVESLPDGYDSVLGERGLRMSGGQRQRLAIARVLLRDPRVMILDEATSALDAETEAGILKTLDEVVRGRTTIAITHRLSLAAKADTIFVVERGRLVEQGTHAELSIGGGLYQRLYDTQTRYTAGPPHAVDTEVSRLRRVPLFAGLPDEAISAIAGQMLPQHVETGDNVVQQGEAGDRMWVIDSGSFDVLVDRSRAERRVATLGAGEFFGEMALLSRSPRNATVRATTPGRLFAITSGDFATLLSRHQSIRNEVERIVEARESALAAARAATT